MQPVRQKRPSPSASHTRLCPTLSPVTAVACGPPPRGLVPGDSLSFAPGGAQAEVVSVEMDHEAVGAAVAGDNIGLHIRGVSKSDVRRGMVCG